MTGAAAHSCDRISADIASAPKPPPLRSRKSRREWVLARNTVVIMTRVVKVTTQELRESHPLSLVLGGEGRGEGPSES